MTTMTPEDRTARAPEEPHAGGVTLINGFAVAAGREVAFQALWAETSNYFRTQPGYLSLRLHRALSPETPHRFVNVARWASFAQFEAAHRTDEFRRLVSQSAWAEFPNSPALYEVAVEHAHPRDADGPVM